MVGDTKFLSAQDALTGSIDHGSIIIGRFFNRLSRRVNNMACFFSFLDVTHGEFHKIAQKDGKERLLLLFRTFCHVVYATLGFTRYGTEGGDKMFDISEDLIKKELKVIPSTGFYKDEEEFLKEAVNTLLAARKDLRISIACELYKGEEISLGKACEIASLNIEEMKEILYKRGIRRRVDVSIEDMESMAKKAVELARQ